MSAQQASRGPMIQISHVAKRYAGGYEALRDVSFSVESGEMVFITGHSGAGKSTLLKLITAIAKKDVKFMLRHISDDIRWNIVGGRVYQGKDEVERVLEQIEVDELTIRHIATHGRAGVGDGTLKLKNGRSQAFCDVFDFTNAKGQAVKEITTYVIDLK